jgi:selenophosphate synthetase-related protein
LYRFIYIIRCYISERKYYSKRLVIIEEIKKVAEEREVPLADAAQVIENERISLGGCSLDKLSKIIKERNRQQQQQQQQQQRQQQ